MSLLQGQHVLITGASRGIGAAIARLFAQHGAVLYLNARHLEPLQVLAAELKRDYDAVCSLHCFDISDADAVKQGFQALFKQTKRLDVLINNAGVLSSGLLPMVSPAQLQQAFATNSMGALYCCQYASRLMQRQQTGSIINMTSIMGTDGARGQAVYSASKAAVIGMTKALAKELAPHHIRVNAIAPGLIATDMAEEMTAEQYQQRLASIGMGYIGQPEQVANTALYLASSMAEYVTGQVIGVDGGMTVN